MPSKTGCVTPSTIWATRQTRLGVSGLTCWLDSQIGREPIWWVQASMPKLGCALNLSSGYHIQAHAL